MRIIKSQNNTSVKNPMNRTLGGNILVIPNEINLLPDIAEKTVHRLLAEVFGAVEPIRAEYANFQLSGAALLGRIESIEEGGTIGPLEIVEKGAELVLYDVEVAAGDPVVP